MLNSSHLQQLPRALKATSDFCTVRDFVSSFVQLQMLLETEQAIFFAAHLGYFKVLLFATVTSSLK